MMPLSRSEVSSLSTDGAASGRIFISYASEDTAVADRIRAGLEENGVACWIAPRDIQAGTSFPAAITAAARSCAAFTLLLTEASNQSPHVLSEVELAFNARRPILAVLVGGVAPSPSLQYFISTTHWFDAESSFDDEDLSRLQVDLQKLVAGEQVRLENDRRRGRRRVAWIAGAAALAVVVLGVGAYLLSPSRRESAAKAAPAATSPSPPTSAPEPASKPATASEPVPPGSAPVTASGPEIRTKTNPADGQVYVWIPPGRFAMGCSPGDGDCEPDELPRHTVRIRDGFWLARTEVTVAQYARRASSSAAMKGKPSTAPVTEVDWAEAKAYCAGVGGRLPTEAEWEYAARAGTTERYPDTLREIAWFDDDSDDHSHLVATKAANAFGLHDMLGNVYEWVRDRYFNQYDDTDDTIVEPLAPNASATARGGAWTSSARDLRVTNRLSLPPDAAEPNVGFRCALSR